VLTFDAERDAVDELSRMLLLSDDVVRHKIVRPGA
jgi:ribosomal protein S6